MVQGISLHIGLNRVDPNHYKDEFGNPWEGRLGACEVDAADMEALALTAGFETTTLLTAAATTAAVVGHLSEAAGRLQSGDIFLVSYSGHGGQVPDRHRDEEADFLDETWCLYDRQLVDDELYACWARFAAGVRILVLSDSCHSGTVTRLGIRAADRATRLLTAMRLGATGAEEGIITRDLPLDVALATYTRNQALYDDVQTQHAGEEQTPVVASILLISGCMDDQLSEEIGFNGRFTAALKTVWDSGRFAGDYPAFREDIRRRLPARQQPNYFVAGVRDQSFERQKPFSI